MPEPLDYETPPRKYPSVELFVALFAIATLGVFVAYQYYRYATDPLPITSP